MQRTIARRAALLSALALALVGVALASAAAGADGRGAPGTVATELRATLLGEPAAASARLDGPAERAPNARSAKQKWPLAVGVLASLVAIALGVAGHVVLRRGASARPQNWPRRSPQRAPPALPLALA